MENLDERMAELNLDTEKISSGFALVIVNDEFKRHKKRIGAVHYQQCQRPKSKEYQRPRIYFARPKNTQSYGKTDGRSFRNHL
jgi:hypothetical protein